jgi:hypothetical protein
MGTHTGSIIMDIPGTVVIPSSRRLSPGYRQSVLPLRDKKPTCLRTSGHCQVLASLKSAEASRAALVAISLGV